MHAQLKQIACQHPPAIHFRTHQLAPKIYTVEIYLLKKIPKPFVEALSAPVDVIMGLQM